MRGPVCIRVDVDRKENKRRGGEAVVVVEEVEGHENRSTRMTALLFSSREGESDGGRKGEGSMLLKNRQ